MLKRYTVQKGWILLFDISYEDLLERALSRVENLDKQEGSFIYDAIAPCVELYHTYLYCNELEKRVFADTAYGEYLDRRVKKEILKEKKLLLVNEKEFLIIPCLSVQSGAKKV